MAEREIPKGYTQKDLRAMGGTVAMPQEWFFNYGQGLGGGTFYLTKENLKKRGFYKTGLSIMYAPGQNLKLVEKHAPGLAEEVFKAVADQVRPLIDAEFEEPYSWEDDTFSYVELGSQAHFKGAVMLSSFEDPATQNLVNIPRVSTKMKVIANKNTGTAYVLNFEAPTDLWDLYKVHGDTMINSLALDPTK